jgi:hypothetical protein
VGGRPCEGVPFVFVTGYDEKEVITPEFNESKRPRKVGFRHILRAVARLLRGAAAQQRKDGAACQIRDIGFWHLADNLVVRRTTVAASGTDMLSMSRAVLNLGSSV